MDYLKMTAPCGLDCFNCPVYLAKDNERLRAAIAKRENIPVEKVSCRGCRDENGTMKWMGWTEPCSVYKCITKKNIDFCCDCDDFPCDNLHPYADKASERPHNTKVFNLCQIKKMGVEDWAQNKAKGVRDTYFKGQFKL
jgi:hypothetical protein